MSSTPHVVWRAMSSFRACAFWSPIIPVIQKLIWWECYENGKGTDASCVQSPYQRTLEAVTHIHFLLTDRKIPVLDER